MNVVVGGMRVGLVMQYSIVNYYPAIRLAEFWYTTKSDKPYPVFWWRCSHCLHKGILI